MINHYASASIETPCIKLCQLDERTQLCIGCWRTGEEIMRWRELDDAQRRQYMVVILPARASRASS